MAVIALAVYWPTLATGLVWGDGPELAAVAASLGIAHPTGYPLFTLLAHGFTRLDVGGLAIRGPAFQVTVFCALCMALTAGLMQVLLRGWLGVGTPGAGDATDQPSTTVLDGLSVAGALAFAFSLGPWSHATTTEVYPLQVLLQMSVFLMTSRLLLAPPEGSKVPRAAALVALFGLALGHHLLALALVPLVAGVWFEAWRTGRTKSMRLVSATGIALLVAALPLLYLPLRAAQRPAINWGDPSTAGRLVDHLSGGDYVENLWLAQEPGTPFRTEGLLAHLARRGQRIVAYLLGQVVPADGLPFAVWGMALLLGLAGWVVGGRALARASPRLALGLGAAMVLYAGAVTTYNIVDIVDYQLGLFALLWPVLWLGGCRLVLAGSSRWRPARLALLLFLLLLPLALALGNRGVSDRSDFHLPDRFAERLMARLPHHTILLTQGQLVTSSAWYQQEALGRRRDVLVVCVDFLGRPWYPDTFTTERLDGRKVPTTPELGVGTELRATLVELARNNPATPLLTLASPRQAAYLGRDFDLFPTTDLLSADESAEALRHGFEPPPARLFRLTPRSQPIETGDSRPL